MIGYTIEWTETFLADVRERIAFRYRQTNDYVGATNLFCELIGDIEDKLLRYPHIGERLDRFEGDNIRRLLIHKYEIRYQLLEEHIYVLNIFHTREDRK
jgi:plasmid stabilization system protein ParE